MKCFSHRDTEAIGICASCQRGLCGECAADMDRGLACKDRCELEVRRLLDLRDFSFAQPTQQEVILGRTRRSYLRSGLFFLTTGLAQIVWGSVVDPGMTFVLLLGIFFFLYGGWVLVTNRTSVRSEQFRLCPKCGYNITGNTSGTCPECGLRI